MTIMDSRMTLDEMESLMRYASQIAREDSLSACSIFKSHCLTRLSTKKTARTMTGR